MQKVAPEVAYFRTLTGLRARLCRVRGLLACPFCRELFPSAERTTCPSCELPLVPMKSLPLSGEARAMLSDEGLIDPPQDRTLSFWFWRRGRGPLTLLALGVLGLFFLPWIELTRPEVVSLTGFDLARSSAPHLFGGAIGAFLLVPLTLSRRSVYSLRGARPIATLFSLLTAAECGLLFFRPPVAHALLSYELAYAPAFYLSGFLSLLAAGISLGLGGSASDFRDLGLDEAVREVGEAVH